MKPFWRKSRQHFSTRLSTPNPFLPSHCSKSLGLVCFEFAAPTSALPLDCMQAMLSGTMGALLPFNPPLLFLHFPLCCPHSPCFPCHPRSLNDCCQNCQSALRQSFVIIVAAGFDLITVTVNLIAEIFIPLSINENLFAPLDLSFCNSQQVTFHLQVHLERQLLS